MTDSFVDLVHAGISELASLDTNRARFGARSHDYRFAPVIEEATLASFEEKAECVSRTITGTSSPESAMGAQGLPMD